MTNIRDPKLTPVDIRCFSKILAPGCRYAAVTFVIPELRPLNLMQRSVTLLMVGGSGRIRESTAGLAI